jgi:DsbC/DsbD-like thiol-disulfide interchange protein
METSVELMKCALYLAGLIAALCAATSIDGTACVPIPHGQIMLVSEQTSLKPGQSSSIGLHFELEPGWHIYWINAGDSGQAPVVKWSAPNVISIGDFAWPVPKRLVSGPLVDYGYEGSVLLMAPITAAPSAMGSAQVEAQVRLVVCREMCLPGKATLGMNLTVSTSEPRSNANANLFSATRKKIPRTLPPNCPVSVADEGEIFQLRVGCTSLPHGLSFFPLRANEIENATPQRESRNHSGIELTLHKSDQLMHPLRVLNGVIASTSEGWQFSANVPTSTSNERSDSP